MTETSCAIPGGGRVRVREWIAAAVALSLVVGCGPGPVDGDADVSEVDGGDAGLELDDGGDAGAGSLPYARGVVRFEPGEGAGYGEDSFPGNVLGPPSARGVGTPSLDVLTLGYEGEIVVGFGDQTIENGPGADFVVFENPFSGWVELGEVSVSRDGEQWKTFDCNQEGTDSDEYPGCAGWRPTKEYEPSDEVPLDPDVTGGDPFDLADVGLDRVNYVEIRGISDRGGAPKKGFDLDAVGIVHREGRD